MSASIPRGAIAAGDPQTVQAGAAMFRQGGNAADALVAAAFAALLAEPFLINIGGGGLATVYDPKTDQALAYDFMVDMPSRPPFPEMDFRQVWVHFEATSHAFYVGRAAAGVPGLVAGLCRLHQDWGRLPLETVMEPAIRLAEEGAALAESQVYVLNILREIFRLDPTLEALYFPGGTMIAPGTRIRRPDLAATLRRIAREGPADFYQGELARAIVQDQEKHGGLITAEDLAHYQVLVTPAWWVSYRGWQVALPGPPSRGGGLVALALHLLSAFHLEEWLFHSPAHLALLAEVMREVLRARPEWEALLKANRATPEAWLDPARLERHIRSLRQRWRHLGQAGHLPREKETRPNTTHISAVDAEGLALSMTMTAGEDAGFVVPGTGIQMNNMLGEWDLNPEGYHKLPPGTRLGTMMTPTLARHPEGSIFVVGSGGSARIRSAVMQVLSAYLDFRLPLRTAVEAPRTHLDPDDVYQVEYGIPETAIRVLEHWGYRVKHWPTKSLFFGGAHAVAHRRGQDWEAVGDSRRGGAGQVVL